MVGIKDAWSVVVATVALLVYGVLQERVMTRAYGSGSQREVFPHSAFLVLCNRLLAVAALAIHSRVCGLTLTPIAPIQSYCMVSASNMLSTLCQYEALKYVSYVTQTLAKTSKALPVLLWGTVIGGKRYRTEQYVHAILITVGCSVFVLGGDIISAVASSTQGSWWTYFMGMCLLLIYLAADGWTSTQQEHLFKCYGTSIREQLIYTTAFSTVYSLAATIAGNQLLPAVMFLFRHPDAAAAVLGLSAMSTIIQVCISHVLQQHGALVFALMMTTRQCASVLLSSVLFGHALTFSQWLGIALVFSALYHQKTGKIQDRRRSAAGRLPQSRESNPGVPLLSKQPSVTPGSINHRGISNSGVAPQTGVIHHKHVTPSISMGGIHMAAGSGHGYGHSASPATLSLQQPGNLHTHGHGAVGGHTVVTPRLFVQHAAHHRTVWHGAVPGVAAGPQLQPASAAATETLSTQLSTPTGCKKQRVQGSPAQLHIAAAADEEQHTE